MPAMNAQLLKKMLSEFMARRDALSRPQMLHWRYRVSAFIFCPSARKVRCCWSTRSYGRKGSRQLLPHDSAPRGISCCITPCWSCRHSRFTSLLGISEAIVDPIVSSGSSRYKYCIVSTETCMRRVIVLLNHCPFRFRKIPGCRYCSEQGG